MDDSTPENKPRFLGVFLIAGILLAVLFFEWVFTTLLK